MNWFQRALARFSDMVYPQPSGGQIMPDYPDQILNRPFGLDPVSLDGPNIRRKVATVMRCSSVKGNDLAGLSLVFERRAGTDWNPVEREPGNIVDVWERANGVQTGYELLRGWVTDHAATGSSYLVVDTYNSKRTNAWELWTAPSHLVEPVPGPRRKPIAYVFSRAGVRERIDAKYVIPLLAHNPSDEPVGGNPLESIEFQYSARYDLMRVVSAFLKSGGVPPGYWRVDTGTGNAMGSMTPDDQKTFIAKLNAQQGVSTWFKHRLAGILKWEQSGVTFKDMMFPELKAELDADVCMVLGVPGWKVGLKNGSTGLSAQSAATADLLVYWGDEIGALAKLVQSVLTERYCSMFEDGEYRCRIDMSVVPVLAEQTLMLAKGAKELTGRAIVTVNEARKRVGMSPIDDPAADELYVAPASPFGGPAQSDSPKPAEPDPAAVAPKSPESKQRMIEGDARREVRRKRHAVNLARYEKRVAAAHADRFSAQESRTVRWLSEQAVRAAGMRAISLDDLSFSEPEDEASLRKIIADLVALRGEEALAQIAVELDINLHSSTAASWIRTQTQRELTLVDGTTKEQLRLSIAEGVGRNEHLQEMIGRVHAVFDGRRANAITIARTETVSAYNFAAVEAYAQSGIVEKLEWLSTQDQATRETHSEADGTQVALGSAFTVGGAHLAFPGDPAGPPEEVINCRCIAEPVVDEALRMQKEIAAYMRGVRFGEAVAS